MRALLAGITLLLTACASVPVHHQPIQDSVATVLAKAQFQQKIASQQVRALGKAVNPAVVTDLQGTIDALGVTLNDATGKLQWYESQCQTLQTQNTELQGKLDQAVKYGISEHQHRVEAAKRADVIIYAMAILGGIGAARFTSRVLNGTGWLAIAGPAGGFACGFSATYIFTFSALSWASKFIPDFSGFFHRT